MLIATFKEARACSEKGGKRVGGGRRGKEEYVKKRILTSRMALRKAEIISNIKK